jgi:hypothetical protein
MKTRPDLLDIDQLVSLGDLTGGGVYQIVDDFASCLMDRVAGLRAISGERNMGEMRMAVHQLKGSALSCGFLSVASMLEPDGVGDALDFSGLEACAWESIGAWKRFLSVIRS